MSIKGIAEKLTVSDWAAILLLVTYVTAFSWMSIRQHEAFHTNALDLAKFDQAIWNTAQGRPFKITLIQDSVIESHFSPILAVFAPLYWIWPNIRLLFIIQAICLGGAGLFLYWFFRDSTPWQGLALYTAYLMHPALHQVNLFEFRRITAAVFATSLALYCLFKRRYPGMVWGLAVALLSKENTAFVAVGAGLYLMLAHKRVKVGLSVLFVGLAWLVLVPLVVLPALSARHLPSNGGYSLAGKYFSYLGDSPGQMLRTVLRNPAAPLAFALRPDRLAAVFDLLWPAAFLFLLAPDIAALSLPFLGYLLTSESESMGQLDGWYPAIILPLLFWATAIGLSRLRSHWRQAASAGLLVSSFIGYATLSDIRPARWSDLERFKVTDHQQQVKVALEQLPAEAAVAAQDPLVPHLSHREQIYLFPWIPKGIQPEYIVLDRELRTYPVKRDAYRTLFYDLWSSTEYEIDQQIDSFIVFRQAEDIDPQAGMERGVLFDGAMTLTGISCAAAAEGKAFGPVPNALPAGSSLRVSLFWLVDQSMEQNYTVFVHALDGEGSLLAQHDSWPADAHRPTSVLPPGTVFRDVHYLSFPQSISDGLLLQVGLYDHEGSRLSTESGRDHFALNIDDCN